MAPASTARPMALRHKAETDPAHGCDPYQRPIAQHLRLGCVNLDKPAGPTSHQVVAWLKEALELEKAGHGGTLDPNVTGVLPVALSDATRIVKTLLEAPKEYVSVVELHGDVPEGKFRDTIKLFQGPVYQIPPLKSAVKRELRIRHIYELEILEVKGRTALFRVSCEAGTYIRKLCTDIGTIAGAGAHMQALRRTKTGPFREATSVTLHDLRDAYVFWREGGDESWLREAVRPVEELVGHLPRVVIRDSAVDALCHGADLAVPGVVEVQQDLKNGELAAVFTLKGELVAVGRARMASQEAVTADRGIALKTMRVVMEPGTYPKGWGAAQTEFRG
ncbi:MAG TPA: RNA-guided pseudouridylation complex pseudouridine synthase subunit Cbf5 [Candidatus Thermoplasmatota archaeon]|nr:RNA-guided pseudouridylation complex pseudouridine synthase subunit Cbf5 [Candidatus Thermoplasmatota archaeon]